MDVTRDGTTQVCNSSCSAPLHSNWMYKRSVHWTQHWIQLVAPSRASSMESMLTPLVCGNGTQVIVALDAQPNVPMTTLEHLSILQQARMANSMFFSRQMTDTATVYPRRHPSCSGNLLMSRFTPQILNLGSNGNWVTCKISDLPDSLQRYADI